MTAAIELENLRVSYFAGLVRRETPAVTDVSFRVEPGEVFGFLGPNGAGKTTTIHTLMGFVFPIGGTARLFDYPAGDLNARRRVGFLPENFAFHRFLTAEKLLRLHLRLAGLRRSRPAEDELVSDLLHRVKLQGAGDTRIGRFSRGMVQRIGLAQALVNDPDLLILDEPTSGLDPLGCREVRELILEHKRRGKTVFLSSHLLSEVELVSDRVAVIDRGSLKHVGRVRDLVNAGDRIEVVISGLIPGTLACEDLRAWIEAEGGSINPNGEGTRVVISATQKGALLEKIRTSGGDVVALNPVRGSLEDLFVKLVEGPSS
jgi:ABC-2 type transport system ATP-binding protein